MVNTTSIRQAFLKHLSHQLQKGRHIPTDKRDLTRDIFLHSNLQGRKTPLKCRNTNVSSYLTNNVVSREHTLYCHSYESKQYGVRDIQLLSHLPFCITSPHHSDERCRRYKYFLTTLEIALIDPQCRVPGITKFPPPPPPALYASYHVRIFRIPPQR